MLGTYERIEYVTYNDGTNTYLITGDNVESCFEVDITSDCFFNTEFTVSERTTVKEINNIDDILDFANKLGIDLSQRYNGTYLLVGGSTDCAILNSLEFDWIEEDITR